MRVLGGGVVEPGKGGRRQAAADRATRLVQVDQGHTQIALGIGVVGPPAILEEADDRQRTHADGVCSHGQSPQRWSRASHLR